MRLIMLVLLFGIGTAGGALAETRDCRAIPDPNAQLACYNNEPQSAPGRPRSASPTPRRPRIEPDKSMDSFEAEDAAMRARINGICRGC